MQCWNINKKTQCLFLHSVFLHFYIGLDLIFYRKNLQEVEWYKLRTFFMFFFIQFFRIALQTWSCKIRTGKNLTYKQCCNDSWNKGQPGSVIMSFGKISLPEQYKGLLSSPHELTIHDYNQSNLNASGI